MITSIAAILASVVAKSAINEVISNSCGFWSTGTTIVSPGRTIVPIPWKSVTFFILPLARLTYILVERVFGLGPPARLIYLFTVFAFANVIKPGL